jgi:hypothetical protein
LLSNLHKISSTVPLALKVSQELNNVACSRLGRKGV